MKIIKLIIKVHPPNIVFYFFFLKDIYIPAYMFLAQYTGRHLLSVSVLSMSPCFADQEEW